MPKAKPTPPIANLHDFVEALSPAVRADIDAVSTMRRVKPGDRLLRVGVLPQEVFQITEGRVKYSAWDHKGRETVLTYMTGGDWVGLSEVFTELPALWNVVAESPLQVRVIRRRHFQTLVEAHPPLAHQILRLFAMRFSLHRLFGLDHSSLTLKERVIKMLYFLSFGHDKATGDSHPVVLTLTQEALGKVVGASRQKLNPVLKALQQEALLEVKFGSLVLCSRAAIVSLAWSGMALVVSLVITQGFLMGFIPPPSPNLSADELARIFIERKIPIRIGTLIQCICYSFWGTWAISIVVCLRRMERGIPVLTYASIANAGGAWVFFLLMPITWAMIAFRPEDMDPKFIQIMNDYVWFIFILSWPPFAFFMIFIAVAIFRDHNVPTIYPRWVAFFNLWCAVLISPAALIEFVKTGPFAYDGLISFWFIYVVFFGWIMVMSVVTLRALSRAAERVVADATADAGGALRTTA